VFDIRDNKVVGKTFKKRTKGQYLIYKYVIKGKIDGRSVHEKYQTLYEVIDVSRNAYFVAKTTYQDMVYNAHIAEVSHE